ncbi:hypothetical protein PMIN01_04113 [Paraphaeosphaeria minitans]|uniref:Uncharacterized protein n=1 Tax=Paraphaeosphaeria minitans TaxID=565426 RepID=A0A9P6GQU0_9PLEO|nr:hypothetical protein PMIN01_04113 [Paraphaeosphaeria minitans]
MTFSRRRTRSSRAPSHLIRHSYHFTFSGVQKPGLCFQRFFNVTPLSLRKYSNASPGDRAAHVLGSAARSGADIHTSAVENHEANPHRTAIHTWANRRACDHFDLETLAYAAATSNISAHDQSARSEAAIATYSPMMALEVTVCDNDLREQI